MTSAVPARPIRAPSVVFALASVCAGGGFLLTAHSRFAAVMGLALAVALIHGAGSLASP